MSKILSRLVVMIGEAAILLFLGIGGGLTVSNGSLLPLAIGLAGALVLGPLVFGLAALLEICDHLQELVRLARAERAAGQRPPQTRPGPTTAERRSEKEVESWLDRVK